MEKRMTGMAAFGVARLTLLAVPEARRAFALDRLAAEAGKTYGPARTEAAFAFSVARRSPRPTSRPCHTWRASRVILHLRGARIG